MGGVISCLFGPVWVSCPDFRDPLYVSIWFGQGVIWGVYSMFYHLYFYVWPGRVINQGQLSIVVSDWEPYLGSPFPSVQSGKLTLFVAYSP